MTVWEQEQPKPEEPHFELHFGKVRLYVDEHGDERWRSIAVDFGEFTDDKLGDCLVAWPREAIAKIRRELDKFEATLSQGEDE